MASIRHPLRCLHPSLIQSLLRQSCHQKHHPEIFSAGRLPFRLEDHWAMGPLVVFSMVSFLSIQKHIISAHLMVRKLVIRRADWISGQQSGIVWINASFPLFKTSWYFGLFVSLVGEERPIKLQNFMLTFYTALTVFRDKWIKCVPIYESSRVSMKSATTHSHLMSTHSSQKKISSMKDWWPL